MKSNTFPQTQAKSKLKEGKRCHGERNVSASEMCACYNDHAFQVKARDREETRFFF